MIQGSAPCFRSSTETDGINHPTQLYHDLMEPSYGGGGDPDTQLRSILCSVSILKHKVDEVESLITMFLSQESQHQVHPFASIGTLIQEIVVNASSMMFNCQQMTLNSSQTGTDKNNNHMQAEAQNLTHVKVQRPNNNMVLSDFVGGGGIGNINNTNQGFLEGDSFYSWYNTDTNTNTTTNTTTTTTTCNNYINLSRADSCSKTTTSTKGEKSKGKERKSQLGEAYDLVEPEAADLLAKYTHYCQVCGKGFKRDANLRMHMRAHGDEYKSSAALSNPLKKEYNIEMRPPRKYSCPQQGCRWNKNHAKFQPLKSIICVKNHYKRTHCPKMYVCKRCNKKQFSVLSDLRTHEKHCGCRKWQCSCGTNFSRKDKLMGHVALFVGHTPIITQQLDNHAEIQI